MSKVINVPETTSASDEGGVCDNSGAKIIYNSTSGENGDADGEVECHGEKLPAGFYFSRAFFKELFHSFNYQVSH